jgi:hypothetical protein
MKKSLLLCCLFLASACTHNNSGSQVSATPLVEKNPPKETSTTEAQSALNEKVSPDPTSYFKIEGSIVAKFSQIDESSLAFGLKYSLGATELIIKDGKAYTLSDLAKMSDTESRAMLDDFCTINVAPDSDKLKDEEIQINGEYQFINAGTSFDAAEGLYTVEANYAAEGRPNISCAHNQQSKSIDDIKSASAIETIVRKNFGSLVSITTIK